MKYLVQKFGGTSLASRELREQVADRIITAFKDGYQPVVVVSAIGRKGQPYATDTLIDLVSELTGDVSPRELDMLMSCGEIISGVIMTATIQRKGFPAVFLTGAQAGIITDENYNNARIIGVNAQRVMKNAEEGKIVVVAGFQGTTSEGEITTLGRGGSDTTAAALGAAINADYVDIYTDVEGIMTADPRIVNDARLLKVITYEEICQLAREGAKVIHPRAVEIAREKNVRLRVKSTFSENDGTLVTSYGEIYKGIVDITRDRLITGITHITGITRLKCPTGEYPGAGEVQVKIFKVLAQNNISVDFINVHENMVAFTVKDNDAKKAIELLRNLGVEPEVTEECAKIASVGAGMTGVPGVMSSIVEALKKENVNILQSADSYTSIWVLVKREDMERAVCSLHEKFNLGDS